MKHHFLHPILSLLLLANCNNQENNINQETPVLMDTTQIKQATNNYSQLVKGNNQFTVDLLKHYQNSKSAKSQNVFLSPLSVHSALSLVSEGAVGKTAAEIQKVAGISADEVNRRTEMLQLLESLNHSNTQYKLGIANAIWAQNNYPLEAAFVKNSDSYYQAKAKNLDFIHDASQARTTINNWVEEKTNYKIKDLLPENSITEDTRLIITNAIYFKADWDEQFDESNTKEQEFATAENKTVRVPMMRHFGGYKYAEDGNTQIIEIPYKNEELSMVIILPKSGNDVNSILNKNNIENYLNASSQWQTVSINLPKFKIATKYMMKDDLSQMGMELPFMRSADFSGISTTHELFIGQVIHQTFIEVNEKGTEAAAATAIDMRAGSARVEPKKFIADHPFVFAIKHNSTGVLLFAGVINNPDSK